MKYALNPAMVRAIAALVHAIAVSVKAIWPNGIGQTSDASQASGVVL